MSNQPKPPHLLDEFSPEQIAELAPHELEAFELLNSALSLSEEEMKRELQTWEQSRSAQPRQRICWHFPEEPEDLSNP